MDPDHRVITRADCIIVKKESVNKFFLTPDIILRAIKVLRNAFSLDIWHQPTPS